MAARDRRFGTIDFRIHALSRHMVEYTHIWNWQEKAMADVIWVAIAEAD